MQASTEYRLARLERSNRILMITLVTVLGLIGVLLISGAADPAGETVRVHRLEVLDNDGRAYAVLGVDADGSRGLFVNDEAGRVRLALVHDQSQSALYAMDSTGTIRIGVAQFAHGGGGVALHGEGGKGATVLYHKGHGSLTFYDDDGGVTNRVAAE